MLTNTTNQSNQWTIDLSFESIFNYFSSIEIVFGSLCNVLTIVVCLREKLRSLASFIFIAFMSVSSLIVILTIGLVKFINETFRLELERETSWWCKFYIFFDFFSYQWISWLIVCYTLELYFSVRWHNFRRRFSTTIRSFYISICIGLITFTLNSPAWSIEYLESTDLNLTKMNTNVFFIICSNTYKVESFVSYFMIVRFYFNYFLLT